MEWISEHYDLIITEQAQSDIDGYIDTIMYTFSAPKTAKKHYDALYEIFSTIQKNPDACAVRFEVSLKIDSGFNIRRMNFKKMAILYTVHDDVVYIRRVIAASMISEV